MQFVLKAILIITIILTVSACSRLQFPWVYRIYIQQGNFIEEDMVEQLEVGMTPEQVRFIMGNPLVADTFHPDRWDYYFTLKRGQKQINEYHFQVFFQDGKLDYWQGSYNEAKVKGSATAELNKGIRKEIEKQQIKSEKGEAMDKPTKEEDKPEQKETTPLEEARQPS
ncbi:Beta-barrel assembly machine subunit BamE [Alteromonadaceae bacterium Bs31]|nr:Beta-barrel assembly machine subunit BamE [Alteromonadaceae bacterium Bs31]